MQGRQHSAECQDGTGFIGNRYDAGAQRLARCGISLGNTPQRLRHGIGAWKIGMRSFGAVAGNRDVDDLRVDLFQVLIAEAVLLRGAGAEVLAEDIGAGHELVQDLPCLRGFHVQRDTLHAPVVGFEIGAGQAGKHAGGAGVVAFARHLDLDHLGAQIGHQHVRDRAGLRGGAGNNLDTVEWTTWLSHG